MANFESAGARDRAKGLIVSRFVGSDSEVVGREDQRERGGPDNKTCGDIGE